MLQITKKKETSEYTQNWSYEDNLLDSLPESFTPSDILETATTVA